jgi:TRAP-type uncharacterized transport system substrate-binding protein
MFSRQTLMKIMWLWVAPLVGVSALVAAIYLFWHSPHERSYRLRMTAGEAESTRHELAQILQRQAASRGLTLEIEPTAGSEAALDAVNAGTLDVALVQGGLRLEDRHNVRQVATLHIEPLHLLVKKELAPAVTTSLRALEGKTVNLGDAGSGTHALAEDVLEFAGLTAQTPGRPTGYLTTTWNRKKLLAEQDRARLPDAVFLVASMPSEVAKALVGKQDYRLVPIAFGEAFSLDGLAVKDFQGGKSPHGRVEKHRVVACTIPAFTYQVDPPVPPTPIPALGTRLLVVAHQDVDAHAVRRLVETVYFSEFASATRPPLDVKLLEVPPEFPWHAGTSDYLDRNTPVVSGVLMEVAQKGLTILAAVVSGLFVLWQWRRMCKQFLGGFSGYIGTVAQIEAKARQIERDQMGGLQQLLELRDELGRLKTEAFDRFTRGELSDRELLQAFLVQANDVRDHVTRLIDRCTERSQAPDSGDPLPR